MRLFFKKKLGSFFKNKKKEAWTKLLRRDEGKIEKKSQKSNYYRQ
jgi:hypothetical protein